MTAIQLNRYGFVAVLLIVAAYPSAVCAQWRVVDRTTNDRLGNVSASGRGTGSVTGNLKDIYEQQKFDRYRESQNAKPAPEPQERLVRERPSALVDVRIDQRCPQPSSAGIATQQWQLCQDIVKTEMAQYNYSLQMYETTTLRQKRLQEIMDERKSIQAHETGKLQDNTNKLLALMSQMEIDRQQQKTYMDAYAARLNYLNSVRNTLAEQALEGTKSAAGGGLAGAGFVSGAAGIAVLKTALDALKTERRQRRN